jgi:hypothetical protein
MSRTIYSVDLPRKFLKELKWLERWVLPPLKLAYETCFFAESAPIGMVAGTGVEPVITNVMSVVW